MTGPVKLPLFFMLVLASLLADRCFMKQMFVCVKYVNLLSIVKL